MDHTWAERLEAEEIPEVAVAFAWTIPIAPVCVVATLLGLMLSFSGVSTVASLLPWVLAVAYAALAMGMFLVHHHKAQDLVARRLGLGRKAARKLDFRGYAKFDESTARAQLF